MASPPRILIVAGNEPTAVSRLREALELAGVASSVLALPASCKTRLGQVLRSDAVVALAAPGAVSGSEVDFSVTLGRRSLVLDRGPWELSGAADKAADVGQAHALLARLGIATPALPAFEEHHDVSIHRLQAIWDDASSWDPSDPALAREYEDELAAAAAFVAAAGAWSLDAGAGSGRGSMLLSRTSRVAALDLSFASLQRLRTTAVTNGARVHPVLGDATRLPFRSGVFSRALGLQVWAHLEQPASLLAELERVLLPSAPVAVSTGNSASLIESWQRLRTGLHELRVGNPGDAARALLGHRGYWLRTRAFARDPVRKLLRSLAQAGFEVQGWKGVGLLRTPRRYVHEALSRRPPFRAFAHLLVIGARRGADARACASYTELACNAIRSFLGPDGHLAYRRTATCSDRGVPAYSTIERYRLICLIGLESCRRAAGFIDDGRLAALARLGPALTTDDLGLLLWWQALAGAPDLGETVAAMAQACSDVAELDTQTLAFLSLGLSAAARVSGSDGLGRRLARALRARQAGSGLFYATAQRAPTSTFNYHVYATMALGAHAQAAACRDSLRQALACARTLCRLQGAEGQWWWTYEVGKGAVADRYPVFSVHQLGMAPAALFRLGRAAGQDFGPWIRRGAAWTAGRNELGESLIDAQRGLVWRSIRRQGASRPWCAALLKRAAWHRQGWVARLLPAKEMNREHRPYEYGWLLAAIAEAGGDESWLP